MVVFHTENFLVTVHCTVQFIYRVVKCLEGKEHLMNVGHIHVRLIKIWRICNHQINA